MFKRTALFALAAAAVIGLSALVSSIAEARPHGGGMGGGGPRVGGHGGMHRISHGHIHRGHGHHRHIRGHIHRHGHRHVHRHHHRPCYGHHWRCRPIARPGFCWRHPWRCHGHHHWHWRTRYLAAAPVYSVARPVASTCTCLVKEYLPTGQVLFRDVCTNEAAVYPPNPADAPPTGS